MTRLKLSGFIVLSACLSVATAFAEDYFSENELFIHAEADRRPAHTGMWTLTFEHFSEWRYGDTFFFADVEGKPDFAIENNTLYFEFAPRFSLDRLLQTKLLSPSWLGELYATVQYNDSDRNFINPVWLYGISFDFAGQPHHGFSNLHFLARKEETQNMAWQVSFAWEQEFYVNSLNLVFRGFFDVWKNNENSVVLTEPQLLIPLKQFVNSGHWLERVSLGTELEISKNFFGRDYGWEVNPTLFFRIDF